MGNELISSSNSFLELDLSGEKSTPTDLQILISDRLKYLKNPLLGYLNINSLRNKITDLRIILKEISLDYFVVSETKLDETFPTAQFNINDYEIRARRDRDKYGGGLIEFIKRGVICKRLKELETAASESICSELTFSKKTMGGI